MALTDIADRKTPSVPIEETFGAQPVSTGRKITTLIGHFAATGNTVQPYTYHNMVNVGDAASAQAEVDALAGAGSQIGKMAFAFVAANQLVGGSNFPAFRVLFLANGDTNFGASQAALTAIKMLRSDMIVSPYPASDTANQGVLEAFVESISGPDGDLSGQFGSFYTLGCIDASGSALALQPNSRYCEIAYLQDTNTALVTQNGVLTQNSNIITGLASTVGIYPGAEISGTGVPNGALAGVVTVNSVSMVDSDGQALPASANEASEAIAFQNVVSQPAEIVATCHAARQMASAFPYNPLQGVAIGFLQPPKKTSDWIRIDPSGLSEAALNAGLSPLTIQPGNVVGFIRTVTTWVLKPDNVTPITAYFDWQDLVLMNDFREDCYLITQNPPFNGNPGGTKASQTIANKLKDEILREAQSYEDQGAFQGVKTLAPQFLVQPSSTSRGRFDFKIPINVIPGLFVIAGNIQAVSGADFGDFTL